MRDVLRLVLQIAAYAAVALLIGYFATQPPYQYGDERMATIKLSLSHATDRVAPCVRLTREEIAELAANMRRAESCERERLPLRVELDVDGENVISVVAEPSGVWKDGSASIYERFDVAAGSHMIAVRLRDTARTEGWDYTKEASVELAPGRYFTVTFRAGTGGFNFR
jgi:hypothetical protein